MLKNIAEQASILLYMFEEKLTYMRKKSIYVNKLKKNVLFLLVKMIGFRAQF
jgi:hypothetical protein